MNPKESSFLNLNLKLNIITPLKQTNKQTNKQQQQQQKESNRMGKNKYIYIYIYENVRQKEKEITLFNCLRVFGVCVFVCVYVCMHWRVRKCVLGVIGEFRFQNKNEQTNKLLFNSSR